jgi:hypothetical protein
MKARSLVLLSLTSLINLLDAQLPVPIVFVTQVPPRVHTAPTAPESITSIGNNHLPTVKSAPRGGDLMIRYVDGTLRNLTRDAGFGVLLEEQQEGAIAVRDPHMHWSGQKILFSMVVNSASPSEDRWQLYEATGFQQRVPVEITRVPNQPGQSNNVQACYAPDDRIIFVSDRLPDGSNSYRVLDEKGQGRINTGLWSLNPATGEVFQMEHSPSGSFDPMVDSYGRVLFTRWDHLQRDEIAPDAGGFDYTAEALDASWQSGHYSEMFPETIDSSGEELGLKFDFFMPWTVNPDGTDLLTLNHVGRHEFSSFAGRSRVDSNLYDLFIPQPTVVNPLQSVRAGALMQLVEHSTIKGRFFGTDAVFSKLSAGRIVTIPEAGPGKNPFFMQIRVTSGNGILRDPAVSINGRLLASVAQGQDTSSLSYNNSGSAAAIMPPVMLGENMSLGAGNPFLIRMSFLDATAGMATFNFSSALAPQSDVTVKNYEQDGTVASFTGPLWQLQPVEVRPTARPASPVSKMEQPEQDIFISAGVSPLALKSWLRSRELALMSVRNVTQRDSADFQQPTSLSVPEGVSSIVGGGGPSYQVKALQMLQGKYLRGYELPGGIVRDGRRIKAVPMHDVPGNAPAGSGMPAGSAAVHADGSVAALVPARRATSWQLLAPDASPVVRERYWLSFQAGEIRSCTSCHGVNVQDHLSQPAATNPPAALAWLLQNVKSTAPEVRASDAFQVISEASFGVNLPPDGDDDGDGVANLVEWGMGSSPVNGADRPSVLSLETQQASGLSFSKLTFSRSRSEARAGYALEASSDLAAWRSILEVNNNTAVAGPDYSLTIQASGSGADGDQHLLQSYLPISENPDRYYRLRVTVE